MIEKSNTAKRNGKVTSNLYLIKTLSEKSKEVEIISTLENDESNHTGKMYPMVAKSLKPVHTVHPTSVPDSPPPVQDMHHPSAQPAPKLYVTNKTNINNNYRINPHSADRPELALLKTQIDYDSLLVKFPEQLKFVDHLLAGILELQIEDSKENKKSLSQINHTTLVEFVQMIVDGNLCNARSYNGWLKPVWIKFMQTQAI